MGTSHGESKKVLFSCLLSSQLIIIFSGDCVLFYPTVQNFLLIDVVLFRARTFLFLIYCHLQSPIQLLQPEFYNGNRCHFVDSPCILLYELGLELFFVIDIIRFLFIIYCFFFLIYYSINTIYIYMFLFWLSITM